MSTSPTQRVLAQGRYETGVLLRNGEQLLVSLALPLLALLALAWTSYPSLGEGRRIDLAVLATADEGLPPLGLDVVLEFHTEWPVVPGRLGPAVDLTALVHQAPALGEVDDGFHIGLGGHG